MGAERKSGVVAKWLNHKGIGFITPDGQEPEEGKDLLVHYTQIQQESEDGFKSLAEGSKVEYDTEADPKDASKEVAVRVTGPSGADCEKRKKGQGKRRSKGKGKRSEQEE